MKMTTIKNIPFEFPELEGTEKQIKWAEDTRRKFVERIEKRGCLNWELTAKGVYPINAKEKYEEEVGKLTNNSAKWWIDNRYGEIFGIQIPN